MGQTFKALAARKLPGIPVFPNRFVIEICEAVHVHYKNLRIMLSLNDFECMANAFTQALDRWKKRGSPAVGEKHIELTRKEMTESTEDSVKVNLNHNLYKRNDGKIFAEGAKVEDDLYIHFKVRDLRLELTKEEFKQLAEAVSDASEALKEYEQSNICPVL